MAEYSVITPLIREAFRKMSASVSQKKRMTEKRGPRDAFRKMSASVSKKKRMTEKRGPRDQGTNKNVVSVHVQFVL